MKLRGLVPNSYIHVSAQFHFLGYINWILFAVRRGAEGPTKDDIKHTAGLLQNIYFLCGVPAAACGPKRGQKVYVQKTASRICLSILPEKAGIQYFARKGSIQYFARIGSIQYFARKGSIQYFARKGSIQYFSKLNLVENIRNELGSCICTIVSKMECVI
jgi:hypothetical protein